MFTHSLLLLRIRHWHMFAQHFTENHGRPMKTGRDKRKNETIQAMHEIRTGAWDNGKIVLVNACGISTGPANPYKHGN